MTVTVNPGPTAVAAEPGQLLLDRAEGIELLGPVSGSGYKAGAALVRRADGQMLQLSPLLYSVLEKLDGAKGVDQVAADVSHRLGRTLSAEQVEKLATKLAALGLLAGYEDQAPPKRNPLLALRWKFLVTNPNVTRWLTAPFTFLFRPFVMWPVLIAFAGVFWFVLIDRGIAGATADAFRQPGFLLLVFALAVVSAGFHEMGHAAACRYGGATPGGMGAGLYLVWPAFYTDVTDSYRLPRRDRLRVDLAGLYFNAVVAVATMVVWLVWRVDALLLLIGLQVLQMVKQLSPVIRADGYHILADLTGVPDLYSHMGPTIKGLLPWRREPSALRGRARLLVTVWVLVMIPVVASLSLGAILMLPRLATSAWDRGQLLGHALPHQVSNLQIVNILSTLLQMVAIVLPVLGSVLVAQRIVRSMLARARSWSEGHPVRRTGLAVGGAGLVALLIWAWWPSGQYQPVRADERGNLAGLVQLVSSPSAAARPVPAAFSPGTHLVLAMVPADGPSPQHPAVYFLTGTKNPEAFLSYGGNGTLSPAAAFPFALPSRPGPGSTQALSINTTNGGVVYNVAYGLLTISNGAPVTNSNSAFAIARCDHCTTVAVSFQLVLIVGQDSNIAPVDAAGALNYKCPSCTTVAFANQIVVTLSSKPSAELVAQLQAALQRLNAIKALGAHASPASIAADIGAVQKQIDGTLLSSGLMTAPPQGTGQSSGSSANVPGTSPVTAQPGTSTSGGSAGSGSSATTTVPGGTPSSPPTSTGSGSTPTTAATTGATPTTSPSGAGQSTSPTSAP